MTIRQQIFAFVLPLFTFCGAIGAFVSYRLQTDALDRAFHEEARSLAVTLSEFIEPADVAALIGGQLLKDTRLGAVMERFDRWQLIGRFYLFDPKTGHILGDSLPTGVFLPSAAQFKGLVPGEVRLLPFTAGTGGQMRLPLVTLTRGGAGIVGLNVPAVPYLQARLGIRNDAIGDFVVAFAIGLAVASVLATFVSRQIGRLERMVETLGTDSFPKEGEASVVQEATDLGISLNVMHDVLFETMERTRNLLPESDRYRSERGLAMDLQRQVQDFGNGSGGGAEAAWFTVGAPPPAAFAGVAARGAESGVAFAGCSGAASGLSAALRAGAAGAYLTDVLKRQPFEEALAGARSLFALDRLAAVEWEGREIRHWRAEGDGLPALSEPSAWRTGALCGVNCLGPDNRAKMDLYLAHYAERDLARVRAELPSLLDGTEPGIALVLRRSSLDRDPAA